MRGSLAALGGGRPVLFPRQVWTPAGGWYNAAPANAQRNTALAFLGVGVLASVVFSVSASKERRPAPPRVPLVSQSWQQWAQRDDPRLAALAGVATTDSPFKNGAPTFK